MLDFSSNYINSFVVLTSLSEDSEKSTVSVLLVDKELITLFELAIKEQIFPPTP